MNTSYLDRGGGRIAYDVQGAGPLVLCVPGMGVLRSVFRFTAPALIEAGHRVATMDLRGHGDSDNGFESYDDEALASDIVALIDHLGGSAAVIGESMGAGAAIIAAAEHPERITGLALMGPCVRPPKPNPMMDLLMRAMLVRPWGPAAWLSYHNSLYPGRKPTDFAVEVARIRASMRRGDHWRSFVQTTRTSHAPVELRLDRIRTPTLVVMGEQDRDWSDASAEGRYAAERLRGELLLVPDAGHYPMAEYPEVVNPVLVPFLSRL